MGAKKDLLHILLLEDSKDDADLLVLELNGLGQRFELGIVDSRPLFETELKKGLYEIVISDYFLPGFSGMEALQLVKEYDENLPFIIVSGNIGEDLAVEAMREGAKDCILKNNLGRLVPAIKRELGDFRIKRAHALALKELEEKNIRYQNLVNNLPVAVYRSNAAGDILSVNPYMAHLFGFDKEEDMVGVNAKNFYCSIKERAYLTSLTKQYGYLENYEIQLKTQRGQLFWASISTRMVKGEADGELYFDGIIADITERIEANVALIESEEKLRSITSSAQDAIVMMDTNGNIIFWNKAAEHMFGYESHEVLGNNLHEILAPQRFHKSHSDAFEVFKKTGEGNAVNKTIELRGLRKGFVEFPMELSLGSVKRNDKWEAIGIVRDISERKEAEQALLKAKEQAEESDRLKTAFLNNLSHEIRTPMNIIQATAQIMEMEGVTEEDKSSYIKQIIQQSDLFIELIDDIVDLSRLQVNELKLNVEPVKPNQLLNDVYKKVLKERMTDDKQQLDIELTRCANEQCILNIDRKRLSKVLENFMDNAIKFTNEGKIELGCKSGTNEVIFFVSDTGEGIEKKYLDVIFEPFRQIDGSLTRDYEGTGIGLTLCKKLTTMMNGRIWVESEIGKGSSFFISFPTITET